MQFVFLFQLLVMIVGPLVKMVMRALGVGVVAYVGSNLLLDGLRSFVQSKMGNVGVAIQQILGLANTDVCINMFLAAVVTRMVLTGMDKASGVRRKRVWNPPGRDYIDA
ncbi:DUF2523 domain-containing protein [Pseudomonas nitroreducens]|uniref:DUF2523 domain-containing protein n=1 Tax=Pseudomonas nitroreducens TaxID=46680 RepID=UPI0028A90842|nr:DUF2523 domain-containing protein [Pseudomonas nitroreducens]